MKALRMFLMALLLIVFSSPVIAGDFDWMKDLNAQASLDPSGFQARLATRFQIGEAKVSAVIGNMKEPALAYMVFRLGEMSHKPVERVMEVYQTNEGKGWGKIAKKLGIKPGSAEFHDLKRGHDLDGESGKGKGKGKHKGKGRGNS